MASAPAPTSGAQITVNLDVTEAQLMEMSVAELEAYLTQVSSFVEQESSTIKGLTTEEGFYQTLIHNSETTIAGLNTSIYTNSVNLSNIMVQQSTTSNVIKDLDTSIKTAENDIIAQDKIIGDTNSTIKSLTDEDTALSGFLQAAEKKFVEDAIRYSSLYDAWVLAKDRYASLQARIKATQTLYDSTVTQEGILGPPAQKAAADLDTAQKELSTLVGMEEQYIVSLNKAISDENETGRALQSIIKEVITTSSLYEAALINQRFVNAQSTLLGRTTIYQAAYQQMIDADSAYKANPTTATQSALTLAQQLEKKTSDDVAAAKAAVDTLQAQFNLAADTSYKATLDSINQGIKTETDNISTFSSRKKIAEANVVKFSSMMEAAKADVARLQAEAADYTGKANSTMDGLVVLRQRETAQQAAVDTDTQTIATLNTRITNLNTTIDQETSSLDEYKKISSVATAEKNTATANYITATGLVNSTLEAESKLAGEIAATDLEIGRLTNTIDTNTFTEKQQDILIMKYGAEAMDKYSKLEKAALEYRETYVRQKRLSTQMLYEDLVTRQIQAASTLAGQQGIQGLGTVNMNTPEINQQLTMFTTINQYLADIAMTYTMFGTEVQQLGQVIAGCNKNLDLLNAGQAITGEAAAASTQAGGTRKTINTLLSTLRTKHTTIFSIFEDADQTRVISSIMEAAYAKPI